MLQVHLPGWVRVGVGIRVVVRVRVGVTATDTITVIVTVTGTGMGIIKVLLQDKTHYRLDAVNSGKWGYGQGWNQGLSHG